MIYERYFINNIFLTALVVACIATYLTWKNFDFFVAKRQYYAMSKFDLLKKKLSMCFTVFCTIVFISIILISSFFGKENKGNLKKMIPLYLQINKIF